MMESTWQVRAALGVGLFLAACTAEFPEGKIACESLADCPSGWVCVARSDGEPRCYREAVDSGLDTGTDTGTDAGCAGQCDDGVYCNGVETCDPSDPSADAQGCVRTPRDCADSLVCTTDSCDEDNKQCQHTAPDTDNDGHPDATCIDDQGSPLGDDCDDTDGERFPGNEEDCDDHDEDCDPLTIGFVDADGDGVISATCCNPDESVTGGNRCGLDCDDDDLAVHTKQPEFCDGKDNDCDDATDEIDNNVAWYLDGDGDLFGAGDDVMLSCVPIAGRSIVTTDCEGDNNAIHPGAAETCDNVDNNCNGITDEGLTGCATSPTEPVSIPINVCLNGLDNCSVNQLCIHNPGAAPTCAEIDECTLSVNDCDTDPIATCNDGDGTFDCVCPNGYDGDGHGPSGCNDINECLANNGGCDPTAACTNTPGARSCRCPGGFSSDDDGVTCVDDDECTVLNGGCDPIAMCTNTPGARTCACPAGYTGDGFTCAPALTGLTLTGATLSPAFNASRLSYQTGVPLVRQTITITPTAAPGVTITINGATVASGTAWTSPTLAIPDNTLTIVVSRTGYPSRSYTVTATRGSQEAYVKASNTNQGDLFGQAVALSADGNTLVVGAYNEESAGIGINSNTQGDNSAADAGAVYVFTRSGSTWTQQAYLKPFNTDVQDYFGVALALSADGNLLAVGASQEDSPGFGVNSGMQADNTAAQAGAVYLFARSGSTWTQQAYVKASNTGGSDYFGSSVALSDDGTTLAVGAYAEDSAGTGINSNTPYDNTSSDAGAVYVFARSGNSWNQQAYVKASNTGAGDNFGRSVALASNGNTLAIGAHQEDSAGTGPQSASQGDNTANNAGAVYVFTRVNGAWSQQSYVKASNTGAGDLFGGSVALSDDGNTMAVGAHGEQSLGVGVNSITQTNNGGTFVGAVYVLTRTGALWSQQAYVKASNAETSDTFAFLGSVSLSADGSALLVGAYFEDGNGTGLNSAAQADNSVSASGAAYFFTRLGNTWSQQAYVKSFNTGSGDYFGYAVALAGDANTWAVSGWREGSSGTGVNTGMEGDNSAGSAGAVYVFR